MAAKKKKSPAKKTAAAKKKAPAKKKTAKKPAKKTTATKTTAKKATAKKTSATSATTRKAASGGSSVDEKKLAKAVADAVAATVKPLVERVDKAVGENRKKIDALSKDVSKASKNAADGPDAREIDKLISAGVKPAIEATKDLRKVIDKIGKAVDEAATSAHVAKLRSQIDKLENGVAVGATTTEAPVAIDTGKIASAVASELRSEIDGLHDAIQDSYKLLESVKRSTESLADARDSGGERTGSAPSIDADAIGAAIAGALNERLGEISAELALLRQENEQLRRENRELHRVKAVVADVDPVIDSGSHDRDDVLAALDGDDDDDDIDDDDDSDVSAEDIMAAASQSGENEAIALDNRARQMLAKIDQMRESEGSSLNERQVWNEVVIFYGADGKDQFYRDLGILYDSGRLVGLPMLTAEVLDQRDELPT